VYTASRDGTVKQWNIDSGEMLRSFTIGAPVEGFVGGACPGPCCRLAASPRCQQQSCRSCSARAPAQ
jgi:hypothetical protein